MGLFSRKDGATPRKPAARPRPSVSSEAQAAELRVRARRRLAGAVALVLAAIVVLPMLLDAERQPVPDNIAIRIPDRNSQFQPSLSEPSASESDSGSGGPVAVNGKQKYRVRVGPFPSREAAQAAQTRLRTLGFGGAFIASQ